MRFIAGIMVMGFVWLSAYSLEQTGYWHKSELGALIDSHDETLEERQTKAMRYLYGQ